MCLRISIKDIGLFLEDAVNEEIDKEADDRERRRRVVHGSLPAFSVTDLIKQRRTINILKPNGHVMHQQFNIQQLYALPTLYLCVFYLSENKQRLVPLTA